LVNAFESSIESIGQRSAVAKIRQVLQSASNNQLVSEADSKSTAANSVEVQVPCRAPNFLMPANLNGEGVHEYEGAIF
jgi:hypothetical protein